MINHLVNIVLLQSIVGPKRISENGGTTQNSFSYLSLKSSLTNIGHNFGVDFPAPFKNAHDGNLPDCAGSRNFLGSFARVHVTCPTANKGFVNLNFSGELSASFVLQGKPYAVHYKPCGFLSDAEIASHLIRTNSVLAIGDHPDGGKPLIQTNWGILTNGSDLHRKLSLGVMGAALPDAARRIEGDFLGPARRADHAIGPSLRHKISQAIVGIRKVDNRFLKSLWFAHDFCPHRQNYSRSPWMSQVIYCPKKRFRPRCFLSNMGVHDRPVCLRKDHFRCSH